MAGSNAASDDAILDAMNRYGGGFAVALARLFQRADATNQAILRDAFRHVFAEYREIVERRRPASCPVCGCYQFVYQGDRQVCADCYR
jgi:hypothetical protein